MITKADKYARLSSDKQFYYRLLDEFENLIDNPKFSDRINELASLAGDTFLSLDEYPEISICKKLYEKINNYMALNKVGRRRICLRK